MGDYETVTESILSVSQRFAQTVGIETRIRGTNLDLRRCPYCKGGGHGDPWTFGINVTTGQFSCFRSQCGKKGNLYTLAKDFPDFTVPKGLYIVSDTDVVFRKTYRKLPQPKEPYKPKPFAYEYLEGCGISKEVIDKYQITTRTDRENILVFPFYGPDGTLELVKYRNCDPNFDPKEHGSKEFAETGCKQILFGMMQCNLENRTLVITEGQIDSMSVATAGVENAVSVPTGKNGFTWLEHCIDWVNSFDEVVVFGDYENGEVTLFRELLKRLDTMVRKVQPEDYKDCKDANEILLKYGKDQIIKCIENAKTESLERISLLSEYDYGEDKGIKRIPTHIRNLDKMTYGGIPTNYVTIISGVTGIGKSTFATQILASALSLGHRVFVYSGEIPIGEFKRGFDRQVAGHDGVDMSLDNWGNKRFFLRQETIAKINRWYADRVVVYDDEKFGDAPKETLLKTIRRCIKKYGVDVILVDNLMTAIMQEGVKASDKYEKQSKFVGELAQIARTQNVAIILVAHKRKDSAAGDLNDAISGSADIVNLAGLNINYDRIADDKNSSGRLIKLTKNRINGMVDYIGESVDFDPYSMRSYSNGQSANWDVGWNPDSDGFTDYTEFDFDDADFPFKEGESN